MNTKCKRCECQQECNNKSCNYIPAKTCANCDYSIEKIVDEETHNIGYRCSISGSNRYVYESNDSIYPSCRFGLFELKK